MDDRNVAVTSKLLIFLFVPCYRQWCAFLCQCIVIFNVIFAQSTLDFDIYRYQQLD
jgi:hypothetical protein